MLVRRADGVASLEVSSTHLAHQSLSASVSTRLPFEIRHSIDNPYAPQERRIMARINMGLAAAAARLLFAAGASSQVANFDDLTFNVSAANVIAVSGSLVLHSRSVLRC